MSEARPHEGSIVEGHVAAIAALERAGRLDRALQLARSWARGAAGGAPDERRQAHLAAARLAWRAGRAREALAHLARARRWLRGVEAAAARVEWQILRASIAVEAGKLTKARSSLATARAAAEIAGDDAALARVLRRIGTIEARAGLPAKASASYRAALAAHRRAAGEASDDTRRLHGANEASALEATLLANLATMEAWLGRHDEAAKLYGCAHELRRELPLEQLNTRAAMALMNVARGARAESFAPLAAEAEHLGDARLTCELSSYLAEELIDGGDLAGAEAAVARARVALAELGGAEALLEPMVDVVEASIGALRGDEGALRAFDAAIAALERVGAAYHAARSARAAALGAVALGDDRGAVAFMARSARHCEPGRIELGGEASAIVPLALALLDGDALARRHASRAVARLGRARTRAELLRAGRDDLAARIDQERPQPRPVGAAWRVDGPDGVRWLTHAALRAFAAEEGRRAVLDLERRELSFGGAPALPLGRQRMLGPLLAHLAARAPHACTIDELARAVWGARSSAAQAAAVKMTIARGRAFLGPNRGLIETRRSTDDRVAYGLTPDVAFFVLRRVT